MDIKNYIRHRFANRKMDKQLMGNVCLQAVRAHLTEDQKEAVNGHMKHQTMFIKTHSQEIRMILFKQQSDVIKAINQKLLSY